MISCKHQRPSAKTFHDLVVWQKAHEFVLEPLLILAHDLGYGGPQEGRMKSPGGSQPPAEYICKGDLVSDSWLLFRCLWRDIKGAAFAWFGDFAPNERPSRTTT